MTVDKRQLIQILSIGAFLFFLGVPVGLFYVISNVPVTRKASPSPTPTIPAVFPKDDIGKKQVIQTSTPSVNNYWVFARVKKLEESDATGIVATVIIDGDPFRNNIRIKLMSDEGKYKIYWYDKEFGGDFKLQLIDRATARNILQQGSLFEFRFPFMKDQLTDEDKKNLEALLGPNGGDWTTLSRITTLRAEILGVIKQPQN